MHEESNEASTGSRQIGAWFLGPKAENAQLHEEMLLYILRDYFYWRRNYYPADEIIISEHLRREHTHWRDCLVQQINEMVAKLKRHFPFYSPRYIGHQLSDQTVPSILGYFAGMLYNPNNVTPEAAPVTVEWELEVAHDLLRMVGYNLPPHSDLQGSRQSRRAFGWAHLASGGTVANIEALWVARTVRYFPLVIKHAVLSALDQGNYDFPLLVKLPNRDPADTVNIAELPDCDCLGLKTNECIYLLGNFVEWLRRMHGVSQEEAATRAWNLIHQSKYSIAASGVSQCYAIAEPAVFVSGATHYSIEKAADILGIGRAHVYLVDIDDRFRLDVGDLRKKLAHAIQRGQNPLAVVAVAGTTEEGAVDPIHEIHDLRSDLEAREGKSFWLHIDAAWAGYVRSVFVSKEDTASQSLAERTETVNAFVSRTCRIQRAGYSRELLLQWGSKDVCSAFGAFPRADSVTVDPHKMGFVPYPCGAVAFQNDRIRHFVAQEAPYITVTTKTQTIVQVHEPPHVVGPFILEGSKPGAAAAACWLLHRLIPPVREGHGELVRASLLAARELYEWFVHWEKACEVAGTYKAYRIIPVPALPPDTNIVCFLIADIGRLPLESVNEVNAGIYRRFTIQAELGERNYSYGQPFFLSRTVFEPPRYPFGAVRPLLRSLEASRSDYEAYGVFVLRATVMSPYITFAAESGSGLSYLAMFMEELHSVAEDVVAEVRASRRKNAQ